MAEYLKKVDLLAAAVEVEYLGRPRMMVSAAKIGMMPSIEAVPMEYHDKVCEEMARRHQAEILELTSDRPQGWIPCSERLPESDYMCLVSCKTKKGVKSVNRAYYSNGFWHGSGSMSGVEAWMPLPEPWKGADDE